MGLYSELNKINTLTGSSMVFLNIGQGDSILIKSRGLFGLIDAGPGQVVSERIDEYIPYNMDVLDFVILTHFDQDHIEGFLRIAKNYKINKLFIIKSSKDNFLIKEINKTILENKIATYYLNEDNDFQLGDFKFNVLWPNMYSYENIQESNDLSIALEISDDKCNVYTAGDLSSSFESKTSNSILDNYMEVLKLGHHGSRTSTSLEFLSQIKPQIGIISASKDNRYGHPHSKVLDNLKQNNVKSLLTFDGNIELKFLSDQIELRQSVFTYKILCF